MAFIEAPTNFYLGRVYDPSTNQLGEDVVYYDSRDLTTHAVVVGMTGSGKTGLCITLLEEAILDNIPAIIIDPKGDITNLALTFPGLSPQEFRPWIDEDDARRANMSPDQFAAHEAAKWRDGLARWGIVPDRLKWLKLATRLNIYTPGSDTDLHARQRYRPADQHPRQPARPTPGLEHPGRTHPRAHQRRGDGYIRPRRHEHAPRYR